MIASSSTVPETTPLTGSSGKMGSGVKLDLVHVAFMRAERGKAKSRRDDMIIAQM
jgi:hypothetical protein